MRGAEQTVVLRVGAVVDSAVFSATLRTVLRLVWFFWFVEFVVWWFTCGEFVIVECVWAMRSMLHFGRSCGDYRVYRHGSERL